MMCVLAGDKLASLRIVGVCVDLCFLVSCSSARNHNEWLACDWLVPRHTRVGLRLADQCLCPVMCLWLWNCSTDDVWRESWNACEQQQVVAWSTKKGVPLAKVVSCAD